MDRLGARDRALMLRFAISPTAPPAARTAWTIVTHAGGTIPSILAAGLPWFTCCTLHDASSLALPTLVLSHLLVQLVKRTVGRGRPALAGDCTEVVRAPDRFSFPSGHAAAAMSVALGYSVHYPEWTGLLMLLAMVVGFSRVRLAVHYPSDVVVGQLLAILTGVVVWASDW
jgi:undecaprenyl-diphosphatase